MSFLPSLTLSFFQIIKTKIVCLHLFYPSMKAYINFKKLCYDGVWYMAMDHGWKIQNEVHDLYTNCIVNNRPRTYTMKHNICLECLKGWQITLRKKQFSCNTLSFLYEINICLIVVRLKSNLFFQDCWWEIQKSIFSKKNKKLVIFLWNSTIFFYRGVINDHQYILPNLQHFWCSKMMYVGFANVQNEAILPNSLCLHWYDDVVSSCLV